MSQAATHRVVYYINILTDPGTTEHTVCSSISAGRDDGRSVAACFLPVCCTVSPPISASSSDNMSSAFILGVGLTSAIGNDCAHRAGVWFQERLREQGIGDHYVVKVLKVAEGEDLPHTVNDGEVSLGHVIPSICKHPHGCVRALHFPDAVRSAAVCAPYNPLRIRSPSLSLFPFSFPVRRAWGDVQRGARWTTVAA